MLAQQQNKNEVLPQQMKIQPKLEVGKEDDEQEKEADNVADKIMRMSSGAGDDGSLMNTGQKVQTMTEPNAKKINTMHSGKTSIQKMSAQSQSSIKAPSAVEKGINSSKGNGQNLNADVQEEMSSKMGTDLSSVKVHTDSNAVQMSKDINAKAFTHGNDIYFNQGQYNTSSSEGKHLLAHELTHTVQQSGSIQPKIQRTLATAIAFINSGNIAAALADPFMVTALSTTSLIGPKLMDVAGMETVLGLLIANGLGVPYLSPVASNPPFSQYSVLQRSSIAYVLGMIKTRQLYMETNDPYVVSPTTVGTTAANDYLNASLNYSAVLTYARSLGGTTAPPVVFSMVSENPDLSVMEKALFLQQLTVDLANATSVTPPNSQIVSGDQAATSGGVAFMTQLGLILNDQNTIKALIDVQAQLMFAQMGEPIGTIVGNSLLASSGDTGKSTGLFASGATGRGLAVGVGYFMYSAAAGTPLEQGLIGNNLTINYPASIENLEIMLNAYGFDIASTLTITVSAGAGLTVRTFTITINGQPGNALGTTATNVSGLPGITVTPNTTGTATGAYLSFDKTYQGSPVIINVSRGQAPSVTIIRDDGVQLMVSTNGDLQGIVNPLEAKELFESGSFISKSIPTLQNSERDSDKKLAKEIVEFSDSLNITQIMTMLTSTTTGSADFSEFFKLSGKGINTAAPIPKKFKDDNPGLTDVQLLKKIEQLDKGELTKCYKSESAYSRLDYDGIIAMLENYRSSQASGIGTSINISSTTDPQGTGINPRSNDDFPDYFNEYIKGTIFGNWVTPLLNMDGTKISRENNDALSALRSLSFLKLILTQKGLTETDFAKMNVKVSVGGQELPANLGEIPTEASASVSAKASADRKKLSTGGVNLYSIQVMASTLGNVNTQKLIYEGRGWTCTTEPASDGSTRLLIQNFANVNDAMAKLNTIRTEGYPNAFVKTNPK